MQPSERVTKANMAYESQLGTPTFSTKIYAKIIKGNYLKKMKPR
jgi:hypothetical protein